MRQDIWDIWGGRGHRPTITLADRLKPRDVFSVRGGGQPGRGGQHGDLTARRTEIADFAECPSTVTSDTVTYPVKAATPFQLKVQKRDAEIGALRREGLTLPQIQEQTGYSYGVVQRACKAYKSVSPEQPSEPVPPSGDTTDTDFVPQETAHAAPDDSDIADAAFWADLPVHPAAELLPMMGDAELDELARDIEANGLMEPIVLWRDDAGSLWLLDGRNRWAALQWLGYDDPSEAPTARGSVRPFYILDNVEPKSFVSVNGAWEPKRVDPTTYVLSANVHRRHLNSEQKRAALAAYLKADPTASDRKVAQELGVSDKTAAKVRSDLERRSEIPNVETRTDSKGRKQPSKKPKPKPTPPTPKQNTDTTATDTTDSDPNIDEDIDEGPLFDELNGPDDGDGEPEQADDKPTPPANDLHIEFCEVASGVYYEAQDLAAWLQREGFQRDTPEVAKGVEHISDTITVLEGILDDIGAAGPRMTKKSNGE